MEQRDRCCPGRQGEAARATEGRAPAISFLLVSMAVDFGMAPSLEDVELEVAKAVMSAERNSCHTDESTSTA